MGGERCNSSRRDWLVEMAAIGLADRSTGDWGMGTGDRLNMAFVTVDESVREDERSNDEEKDEDIKGYVCQLLDQRTASQRRDKSCAPSH